MGQSYPTVPTYPLETAGQIPQAVNSYRSADNSNATWCPICGKKYSSWRGVDGSSGAGGDPYVEPPPFPHIAYQCGGIWRDVGGVWSGRCMAPVKQLVIEFAEETV